MGPERHGRTVPCVLCQMSVENIITGPLSTKDSVNAHQNCLLYSSGICCENSPEFDDLFGFSVEDVKKEMKRGGRLKCSRCKKSGATVGCEVKICKKSYHYPCAVQDGAINVEDTENGTFTLYCKKHDPQLKEAIVDWLVSPYQGDSDTSEHHNGETPSKLFCSICKNKEENISTEHVGSAIFKLYCEKHRPQSSSEKLNGQRAVAGPSCNGSDSNISKNSRRTSSKRPLSPPSKQDVILSKRKFRRILENSSDSEEDGNDYDMELAPLETDLDSTLKSEQTVSEYEHEPDRTNAEAPIASKKGHQPASPNRNAEEDDAFSDSESQSLLLPVTVLQATFEHSQITEFSSTLGSATGPGSPQGSDPGPGSPQGSDPGPGSPQGSDPGPRQGSKPGPGSPPGSDPEQHDSPVPSGQHVGSHSPGPPDDPDSPVPSGPLDVPGSPHCTLSPVPPSPTVLSDSPVSPPPSPLSVVFLPSHVTHPSSASLLPPGTPDEPNSDSAIFWKKCNEAGCTQSIFTAFINDMISISKRIRSNQASQEDYDLSLRVMEASGKLARQMEEQEKDLERRQRQLQGATEAMKKAFTVLRR